MMRPVLRGLYAITPTALCADRLRLLAGVTAALRGGAALIQYRDKLGNPAQREDNAGALLTLCREYGAKLIVNDDIDLALRLGADGVHLGAGDAPLAASRARLGAQAILGASCANSLPRARDALAAGASYVAFGRFFDSRTKPNAPQATTALLTEARAAFRGPICAIGGVTPDNGAALLDAGADLLAAVEGVFGHETPDAIEAAAGRYVSLFKIEKLQ